MSEEKMSSERIDAIEAVLAKMREQENGGGRMTEKEILEIIEEVRQAALEGLFQAKTEAEIQGAAGMMAAVLFIEAEIKNRGKK